VREPQFVLPRWIKGLEADHPLRQTSEVMVESGGAFWQADIEALPGPCVAGKFRVETCPFPSRLDPPEPL